MEALRGNEMAMIFQEPLTSLNPVFTVGDQIAEQVKRHMNVSKKEAWDRAIEAHPAGRASPARSGASSSTRTSSRAACASA